jgi:TonB family protein
LKRLAVPFTGPKTFPAPEALLRRSIVTLAALLLVAQLCPAALAQEEQQQGETKQPAFTLHSRVQMNMDEGGRQELKEVRYVSSSGNFRAVYTRADGSVSSEQVFVRGRGFFNVHHDHKLITPNKSNPPDTATTTPPPTAEQLRASPHFVRTEEVLGRTTYVHRINDAKTGKPEVDYYFTPELGRVPLKTVEYAGGKVVIVTEPTSIAFGEPEAAQLKLPDYELQERLPVSGGVLNGKAVKKPAPKYPAAAIAEGAQGVVVVQITIDEAGNVMTAAARSGHPLLQEAAVTAALKAKFSPTRVGGQPVKVSGLITYNFVL